MKRLMQGAAAPDGVRSEPDTTFLNLFRGLAALWVMIAHCFIWGMGSVDRYNVLEPKKAVILFMVISGFLMLYTIDRGRSDPGRWITWQRFYLRRYFRIAPAYYLALATVMLLWTPWSDGIRTLQSLLPERWAGDSTYGPQFQDFGPLSILLHLTFLFGLFPDYSFSTSLPDWSLSLEMQFYAVFPIIYLAVRRLPFLASALVLAAGAYAAAHVYYIGVNRWWPAYDEPSLLVLNLQFFLVGMLIYETGRRRSPLYAAGALGLMLWSCRGAGASAGLLILAVVSLAALWALGTPRPVLKLLRSRVVTFLSDTSYSVYLFHGLLLCIPGAAAARALAPYGHGAVTAGLLCVVLPGTYVLAYLVYRTVEVSGNNLGKRLTGSRGPTAPPMT